MTKQELRAMPVDFYGAADIAPLLGADAQELRSLARETPEAVGFPVICWGSRVRIPKRAFWTWWDSVVGWDEEQTA